MVLEHRICGVEELLNQYLVELFLYAAFVYPWLPHELYLQRLLEVHVFPYQRIQCILNDLFPVDLQV